MVRGCGEPRCMMHHADAEMGIFSTLGISFMTEAVCSKKMINSPMKMTTLGPTF